MSGAGSPWLGIIADDFTGATDVAGYLVREGTATIQLFGVPADEWSIPADVDCVVIALKTRSVEPAEAVSQSLAAAEWFRDRGITHVYFKYCSTFDSTVRGNIGPVADALAMFLGETTVIVCPSAPENARTVYQGKLFVADQTLDESSLRDHPVNPMRDSDLPRLLGQQSSFPVGLIPYAVVQDGAEAVFRALTETATSPLRHFIIDAIDNGDLDVIAQVALSRTLSTGSAGLAAAMARVRRGAPRETVPLELPDGASIVISGSCSAATQEQVEQFCVDHPSFEVDPLRIEAGEDVLGAAIEFLRRTLPDQIPLVYSTAARSQVEQVQLALGVERAAQLVEAILSRVAREAVAMGVRRFIVAGGETSGAVVSALRVKAIRIGREVAVGVPWSVTAEDDAIALILKSGNFGGPNFFAEALAAAE